MKHIRQNLKFSPSADELRTAVCCMGHSFLPQVWHQTWLDERRQKHGGEDAPDKRPSARMHTLDTDIRLPRLSCES